MQNVLAHVGERDKLIVALGLRSVDVQPDPEGAHRRLAPVMDAMVSSWAKAAKMVERAQEEAVADTSPPPEHWTRIRSTNPLECLNRGVKHRINVVAVFPDVPSVEHLEGTLLVEQDDEWQVGRHYFGLTSMRKLRNPVLLTIAEEAPFRPARAH